MGKKEVGKDAPGKVLPKVVVECDPDEILVKALGLSRKEVAHQNCKGEVCKYLEKGDLKIGIVDEDPGSGQPGQMKDFKEVEEKFGIKKLLHKNNGKIILVIRPRLEEWILDQCKISKINPADFQLPKDAKRLKDRINLKLDKFKEQVEKLKESGSGGLVYLQAIIVDCYK